MKILIDCLIKLLRKLWTSPILKQQVNLDVTKAFFWNTLDRRPYDYIISLYKI